MPIMKNYLNWNNPLEELVEAIHHLSFVLAVGQNSDGITKQDLDNLEQRLNMKLSKIKEDVALVNSQLTEGLAEITARIDQLVADNADPEVTDEVFTAELEAVKQKADALANLANPTPSEPPSTDETPGEQPVV